MCFILKGWMFSAVNIYSKSSWENKVICKIKVKYQTALNILNHWVGVFFVPAANFTKYLQASRK